MQKDNIDDKLFDAVLKIAAEEAVKQEMENMPSDEELNAQYEPSHNLDKRIKKMIAQYYFKGRVAKWRKTALKIAIGAAIFIIVSSTMLLSVEATRNYIFNAVIKWQEDHFLIENKDDENVDAKSSIFRPTYLPKGFKEISINTVGKLTRIIYQNEEGIEISLKQYPSKTSKTAVDNENKKFIIIKINGKEAYLCESMDIEKESILIWELNGIVFNISSEIGVEELILIAESIKK